MYVVLHFGIVYYTLLFAIVFPHTHTRHNQLCCNVWFNERMRTDFRNAEVEVVLWRMRVRFQHIHDDLIFVRHRRSAQRNASHRARFGTLCTNRRRPAFIRASICDKWLNCRTVKIWTIGWQCTVSVISAHFESQLRNNYAHYSAGYTKIVKQRDMFRIDKCVNSCDLSKHSNIHNRTRHSGRLFQSHQSDLWHRFRVLQRNHMPDYVGRTTIRIPVGRQRPVPQTDRSAGAQIHWAADGLDGGADQRRARVPRVHRYAVSANVRVAVPQDSGAAVPSFRARVHPSFWSDSQHRCGECFRQSAAVVRIDVEWYVINGWCLFLCVAGSSREHLLQAFLLLRERIWACFTERAGSTVRNDQTNM